MRYEGDVIAVAINDDEGHPLGELCPNCLGEGATYTADRLRDRAQVLRAKARGLLDLARDFDEADDFPTLAQLQEAEAEAYKEAEDDIVVIRDDLGTAAYRRGTHGHPAELLWAEGVTHG